MPTPLPSIKSTSGEGFFVEDAVVALLAGHLLAGISWHGAGGGLIQAIDCQVRQDGWEFDDAIVHLESAGRRWRCACSIKSYGVLGKEGVHRPLVRALWNQWQDVAASGFQRENDSLTIVAAHHDPEVREAWINLCDAARAMLPETLADRCLTGKDPSPLRRANFDSLQIETTLGEGRHSANETARLLQIIRLVECDFHHSNSQSTDQAVLLCQQLLADDARDQAGALWAELVRVTGGIRRKGGQITLPILLDELAHRFPLKQHPSYVADWAIILDESKRRMETLPAKIGDRAQVQRRDLLGTLTSKAQSQAAVVVLGASGNGKSVLSQKWAGMSQTVWLSAFDLSATGGLRTRFGISHGIKDLLANTSQPLHLVLDGLDKCILDTAFDEAATVLKSALSSECRGRFQVVVTCCPEDWERVRAQLIRRGISFPAEVLRVERFNTAELRDVFRQIPSLRILGQRPHLVPILRWPKALDIVATYWRASDTEAQWVTESNFARWFWHHAISEDQPASFRDRVARKLGVLLADQMSGSVPLDHFDKTEVDVLLGLAHEGHIDLDSSRRTARFTHDLLADWSRQQELQAQGEHTSAFIRDRLHSPFWHQALRFHALDLLESYPDGSAWHRLFAAFAHNTPADEMAQNLLIDAPIFAAEQQTSLERLWPLFQQNKGVLLGRFLRQFLRTATIPDEQKLAQFSSHELNLDLELSALFRSPWIPYWGGVLRFLDTHRDAVNELAAAEVAEISHLWLSLHGYIPDGMKEAANLAIDAAERLLASDKRYDSRNEVSVEEKICRAMLAATPEMPQKVSELALKLSGRVKTAPEETEAERIARVSTRLTHSPFIRDYGPPVPWPEGPQQQSFDAFRKAFMNGINAAPFIRVLPETAAEILFAILLNIPRKHEDAEEHRHHLDERGFIRDYFFAKSPLWSSGPFLQFLTINPSIGLCTIIKLVNFATDRAGELRQDYRQKIDVPVKINGEIRLWSGHRFTYLWHEGHVFGPRAIGCALLSLEKWFYLLMDAGHPLNAHLATILEESRSIALASVLICVGKRKPELFLSELRPILGAVDFYVMDAAQGMEGGFNASTFYERATPLIKLWQEWVQMPHRKELFGRLVLRMFLGNEEWRDAILDLRQQWETRLASATSALPAPPWLPSLISQFDLTNWHAQRNEQGLIIQYTLPDDLPKPTPEETERLQRMHLLGLLPFECRQALMGKNDCSEEQMVEWWSQLDTIRSLKLGEGENGLRDSRDALCGIVAVAIVRYRPWLGADPAREQTAFSILAEIGANPPEQFWVSENDSADFKWDNFAAWALTTLWCEKPDNPFLLESVGGLALWERYIVVERVMSIAAQKRERLGKYFERLLAHTIQYASARDQAQAEKYTDKKSFDLQAWLRRHLRRFALEKTKPLPALWKDLVDVKRSKKDSRPRGGYDIGHLCAALTWASDLTIARDEGERLHWRNLHKQTLICALTRIQSVIAVKHDDQYPYDYQEASPYDDERRVLERIAHVVAHSRYSENHREMWEPIFALGSAGSHWITAFISQWLLEAAGHDDPAPAFLAQWIDMLAYAENSTVWEPQDGDSNNQRDLWGYLLGFSPFGRDFWHGKLAFALEGVREYHERWACANVRDNWNARIYIHFLETSAAQNLRIDGLKILHRNVPLANQHFWCNDAQNAFAAFLHRLQEENWGEILQDKTAQAGFMAFALRLAALQHPLGSEILVVAGSRLKERP